MPVHLIFKFNFSKSLKCTYTWYEIQKVPSMKNKFSRYLVTCFPPLRQTLLLFLANSFREGSCTYKYIGICVALKISPCIYFKWSLWLYLYPKSFNIPTFSYFERVLLMIGKNYTFMKWFHKIKFGWFLIGCLSLFVPFHIYLRLFSKKQKQLNPTLKEALSDLFDALNILMRQIPRYYHPPLKTLKTEF